MDYMYLHLWFTSTLSPLVIATFLAYLGFSVHDENVAFAE